MDAVHLLLLNCLFLLCLNEISNFVRAEENESESELEQYDRIGIFEAATLEEFPHQICLRNTSIALCACSGALISPHYVVTTASCFKSKLPSSAWAGVTNTSKSEIGQQEKKIGRIIHYSNLTTPSTEIPQNDIVLLEIIGTFTESVAVKPIRFRASVVPEVLPLTANLTGWGITADSPPNILQKSEVQIEQNCGNYWPTPQLSNICTRLLPTTMTTVTPTPMPAPTPSPVRTISVGDGSTLICDDNSGINWLCGLSSFADNTREEFKFYSRISFFSDWIQANVKSDRKCEKPGYFSIGCSGRYFQCVFQPSQGTYLKYYYTCPANQCFDDTMQMCKLQANFFGGNGTWIS